MDQFKFTSSQKMVLLGAMGLGVLCLLITFLTDDHLHTRFWSNFLHNSVFFTGIAFISLFFMCASITAWAGWFVVMKRVWEAYSYFMMVGLGLMAIIIVGLWAHWHHLYHWADVEAVAKDAVLTGKKSFLNKGWYTFGTLIIVGAWIYFAWKLRQLSLDEDVNGTTAFTHHHKMRVWSAAFLPIAGFSSAAIIWQWVMSVNPHWYSTLFAWYAATSWFDAALGLTILTLVYLKTIGYFESVTTEHLHDLGKYMFAFSIFWTYLWFSQYMLIWYGNVGEETVYFRERLDHYRVLFYGNLVLNFAAPFLILMRNDTKRKYGTLVFASVIVFLGHWIDYFLMIKPGVVETAHEELGHSATVAWMGNYFPGLLELGTMIGFLGLFLYFVFQQLEKASLVPKNDPYMGESLHHEASAIQPDEH